jgi:hypothetical protein
LNNGKACGCINGGDTCALLPDIIISDKMSTTPVVGHLEYAWDDPIYPRQLRLAVGTANIGSGPIELIGSNIWLCGKDTVTKTSTCKDGKAPRQILYQMVYHKMGDTIIKVPRIAGTNYFDNNPGHNHYHADRWVDFTLRKADKKSKDPKKWKIVGRSTKASYCLFDSHNCTEDNQLCQGGKNTFAGFSNLANYGLGHYTDCKSDVQGISVGGIDNYGLTFEGQEITIPKGTKNGLYYVVLEVDPLNIYQEQNEDNNIVIFPVELKLQEK